MSRPFGDVLGELAAGETYDRLSEALAEVVLAVQDTGKVGELTLNLKIKRNGEQGISIADQIKAKVPEGSRGESLFFTDADGGLHRSDPRQRDLPLRRVGGELVEEVG